VISAATGFASCFASSSAFCSCASVAREKISAIIAIRAVARAGLVNTFLPCLMSKFLARDRGDYLLQHRLLELEQANRFMA
jgi:hypothetical protein